MKIKVRVASTVYETQEVELPRYTHYDTSGDDYRSEHWVRHEEKRHITVTERDYYQGHKMHEIEVRDGHGIGGSGSSAWPSNEAEFSAAIGRLLAFVESVKAARS